MKIDETEAIPLLAEGAVYLVAAINALHRLGVDMRASTSPYIADVEKALNTSINTGWPSP